jgi:lipopolysaccharide export system protein LptA
MLPMIPTSFSNSRAALLALALTLPLCAHALPEDDAQPANSEDFLSLDLNLNEGEWVQTAHPDRPTCLTQGSRKICGAQIRIQRNADGTLKRVTATGTPANFQQQPEVGAAVVHFSGRTLVFDQDAQLVTVDGDARFEQGTTNVGHVHFEYHLDTGRFKADAGGTDARGRMSFTPDATGN